MQGDAAIYAPPLPPLSTVQKLPAANSSQNTLQMN